MTASSATLAGRAAAEALMVDACTITRGGGERVLDTSSGEYVLTAGASVYSGACRVKPSGADRVSQVPGANVSLFPYLVSVPLDGTVYEVDDVVTVTASTLDPALAGLVLRVRHVAAGSHLTARRLGCEVEAG